MVNFDLIIKRVEALKGLTGDKHVASILGISPQDFSNRKKRGSLLPVIFEWAINENVNLEWLIKGVAGEEIAAQSYPPPKPENRRLKSLIDKLTRIINEGNDKKIKAVEAQLDLLDPGESKKGKNGGFICLNFLVCALLPVELILAMVGLELLSGPTAWKALSYVPYYWCFGIAACFTCPVIATKILKSKTCSIIRF